MISKITELYILWGEIQIPTARDSSVLKWLQRWQNLKFFEGTFKFRLTEPHIFCWDIQIQLEKTVQYPNDFKSDRNLHCVWGHSDSDWKNSSVSKWFQRSQNFTSSILTFKFQMKKKNSLVLKWFQRWQNHAFFVDTFMFQLKNQFSIEMI